MMGTKRRLAKLLASCAISSALAACGGNSTVHPLGDYLTACPAADLIAKAAITPSLDVVKLDSGPAVLVCNYVHPGDVKYNPARHPDIFSIGIIRVPATRSNIKAIGVNAAVASGEAKYVGAIQLVEDARVIVTNNRRSVATSLTLPKGGYVYIHMTLAANTKTLSNAEYLKKIRAIAQACGL